MSTDFYRVDGATGTPVLLGKADANGRVAPSIEPLGIPAVARQLAAGASSANTALTATCRRVSIFARGAAIRYAVGSTAQTASGSSHYIEAGERIDIALPTTPNLAVIRAGSTDGTLEVTELA